jgi:hypothetical protein
MADAADSKSVASNGVWVRLPPSVLQVSWGGRARGLGRATPPTGHLLAKPLANRLQNDRADPGDESQLLGSLVGQSERNVRQALRLADAMAPCVVFADE